MQTEKRHEESSQFSLEPVSMILDVLRRWYLIVMAVLLAGMAGYVASDLNYTPQYTTTTTFVVSVRDSAASVYQNLSATTNLATVFSEVLNSSLLRQAVVEASGLERFNGTITSNAIEETNLLTLRVTDDDPRTAFLATKAIIENHSVVSYQVLGDTVLEVLQAPHVPTAPSNPKQSAGMMKKCGLAAGVCMCVLLAVLSVLQDTIRSKKDAEGKLGCRVLAEIRHERKYKTLVSWFRHRKNSILISNPITSFGYVESIIKLRRRVEYQLPAGLLLVTSVAENEGKSTIAANLALALARKHARTLLIECDLMKPACYKLLEKDWQGPGTLQVIEKTANLKDAVQQDKNTGLYMLLEKESVRNSTEVSASEGMTKMLQEAKACFDYVIIDTSPMSAGANAECLMDLADASLLVMQQNVVPAVKLAGAVETLSSAKAKFMGCVLNNVYALPSVAQYGYGYGYRYGYGRYGHYGKQDKNVGLKQEEPHA